MKHSSLREKVLDLFISCPALQDVLTLKKIERKIGDRLYRDLQEDTGAPLEKIAVPSQYRPFSALRMYFSLLRNSRARISSPHRRTHHLPV